MYPDALGDLFLAQPAILNSGAKTKFNIVNQHDFSPYSVAAEYSLRVPLFLIRLAYNSTLCNSCQENNVVFSKKVNCKDFITESAPPLCKGPAICFYYNFQFLKGGRQKGNVLHRGETPPKISRKGACAKLQKGRIYGIILNEKEFSAR